jgi:hypothetical protein
MTRSRIFVVVGVLLCGALAYAQPKPKPKPAVTAKPAPAPKPAGKGKDAGATEPREANPMADAGPQTVSTAGKPLTERTLDGGSKVFRFGELEVEGRLRSPQLVYFLRRVRAEFAAGDLGHRSFMLELSQTRQTDNF